MQVRQEFRAGKIQVYLSDAPFPSTARETQGHSEMVATSLGARPPQHPHTCPPLGGLTQSQGLQPRRNHSPFWLKGPRACSAGSLSPLWPWSPPRLHWHDSDWVAPCSTCLHLHPGHAGEHGGTFYCLRTNQPASTAQQHRGFIVKAWATEKQIPSPAGVPGRAHTKLLSLPGSPKAWLCSQIPGFCQISNTQWLFPPHVPLLLPPATFCLFFLILPHCLSSSRTGNGVSGCHGLPLPRT